MSSPGNAGRALVADAGERDLIDRIHRRLPPPPAQLVVGIGDDAAVAVPDRGALQVLTTDALVEGVHFDWRFSAPADVGYRALAVNVSDVAAMGGAPRLALLSLMLPPSLPLAVVDALLDGLLELANALGVTIAGGNITRSPGPLIVDVSLVGSVKPRKLLRRAGGRPGDQLYVSGSVGAASAGLGWLRANVPAEPAAGAAWLLPGDQGMAECVARYRRPEPRARLGALLGRNRAASACMDLSDGLADAVSQVAEACGTGARIDADALPIHPAARAWFTAAGVEPVRASAAGGDDYELLFAVPRRRQGRLRGVVREARGLPVTRIGELTKDRDVVLVRAGAAEPLPAGFTHF